MEILDKLIRRLSILLVFILPVFLNGCTAPKAYYNINLKQVVRPTRVQKRYGEQKITEVKEEGTTKYCFEDEMVKILWLPTSSRIGFKLINKTNHSIKVVWDEAAFIDEDGESHRVTHSGVRYIDRNKPQPPSIIARKATISDVIVPADYIDYESGKYGGWDVTPLFPNRISPIDASSEKIEAFRTEVKKYIGKTIQILLPLQIQDVVNEYTFSFEVKDVKVKEE